MTWKDANKQCKVIRSHGAFLIALNMTEGGVEYPDAYRWSTPADENGIPFTWDETDLSGLAGTASLGGDGGAIIDGLSLRDAFMIYSEKQINVLHLTGNNLVFARKQLTSTFGLIARSGVVEVKGVHLFIADGDILMNDGNSITSIAKGKLRKRMMANVNSGYYANSYAFTQANLKEAWFCVPEGGSFIPNTAYVYNWVEESWSIRDLPQGTVFSAYGFGSEKDDTFDTAIGTFDDDNAIFNNSYASTLNNTVISIGEDNTINRIDIREENPYHPAIIERTGLLIDEPRTITTINRVYPLVSGNDTLTFEIGSQYFVGGPVFWTPPQTYRPGNDRKIDVRCTGAYHTWRVKSAGVGQFKLTGFNIEYEVNGVR